MAADLRVRILEAAAQLLRDRGVRSVTTRAVAETAGVPHPTIFRIFGDKDALMDAVAEHVLALHVAAKTASVGEEQGDPVDDLHTAWTDHIAFGLANPELFALLAAPSRSQSSSAAAAGAGVLEKRVARLAAAGLLGVSQARAAGMIHAAGSGVVLALSTQRPENRDSGLAEAVFASVLGGIMASSPSPPTTDLAALVTTLAAAAPTLPALSGAERALLVEWCSRSMSELQGRS